MSHFEWTLRASHLILSAFGQERKSVWHPAECQTLNWPLMSSGDRWHGRIPGPTHSLSTFTPLLSVGLIFASPLLFIRHRLCRNKTDEHTNEKWPDVQKTYLLGFYDSLAIYWRIRTRQSIRLTPFSVGPSKHLICGHKFGGMGFTSSADRINKV